MIDNSFIGEGDTRRDGYVANINFFMCHLSISELKIIERLCQMMSREYSKSYNEWLSTYDSEKPSQQTENQ